jgi:hypothetical protein
METVKLAQKLSTASYLIFRVQPNIDFGYTFNEDSPINQNNIFFTVQFLGFWCSYQGSCGQAENT